MRGAAEGWRPVERDGAPWRSAISPMSYGRDGRPLPITGLPEVQSTLSSVEVVRQNLTAGGTQEWIVKVKAHDKMKALEMLARHFALLGEQMTVEAGAELLAIPEEGRRRVAGARAKWTLPAGDSTVIDTPAEGGERWRLCRQGRRGSRTS